MNTDILLLAILGGITLLAYMVAINARGPTRLSISYLFATMLLAGTVWAIVSYVNTDIDRREMARMRQLEQEKQQAELRIQVQEEALRTNKARSSVASRCNTFINNGSSLATAMMNVDLRDMSVELEALIARANDTRKKTNDMKTGFEQAAIADSAFTQVIQLIKDGTAMLIEASQTYVLFYRSEDPAQEELRERVMRQKAKAAYDKFQQASALVASLS